MSEGSPDVPCPGTLPTTSTDDGSGSGPDSSPGAVGAAAPGPDAGAPPRRPRRRPPRRRGPKEPSPPPAIPERTPPPDYLVVGRIAAPHGTQGEFRLAILTNHPEHLEVLRTFYLGDDRLPLRVRRVRIQESGGEALVRVTEFTTPDDVVERKGELVWMARLEAPPLPEGEFYHYELLGLDVVDLDGRLLGRVAEIIETGANDVYAVRGPEGEMLLPVIESVIREIDPANGRMVVDPPQYY